MKLKSHIFFISFSAAVTVTLTLLGSFAHGQSGKNVIVNLPEVSLLDIEPAGAISMSFTAPTESGSALTSPGANTSKWINYTSAVAGTSTKKITVACNATIPGIDIKVQAGSATGVGGGVRGVSTGAITLSTTAKTIITGIGGAYTGDGVNNGHQLTITMMANTGSYSLIKAQSNTQVQITYTISSN